MTLSTGKLRRGGFTVLHLLICWFSNHLNEAAPLSTEIENGGVYVEKSTVSARADLPSAERIVCCGELWESDEAEDDNSTLSAVTDYRVNDTHKLGVKEQQALWLLYNATEMWSPASSDKHDWFKAEHKLEDDIYDYCSFKGVECTWLSEETAKADDGGDDDANSTRSSVIARLQLNDKGLVGTLPEAVLASLPSLRLLDLSSNELRGPIPLSISTPGELRYLDLSHNRFSGYFPNLNTSANIRRIMLQYNLLKGSLPSQSLCAFRRLKALDISGNEAMHGTLPHCLDSFKELESLKFDGVGLSGDIPPALCSPHRKMNGFNPNAEFGCSVIACPIGTFEETLGRQRDASTPCRPCFSWAANDPLALLLGSQTCPIPPTQQPSEGPTLVSTLPPTERHFGKEPTREPIAAFSSVPSATASDVVTPGTGTLWVKETLIVEVALVDAHRSLNPPGEVAIMEELAVEFLREQVNETDFMVWNLTITRQRMTRGIERSYVSLVISPPLRRLRLLPAGASPVFSVAAMPRNPISWMNPLSLITRSEEQTPLELVQGVPTDPTEQVSQLSLFGSPPMHSRVLQTISSVLVLTLEVVSSFASTSNATENDLISYWDQNMDGFVALVKASSGLADVFGSPSNDVRHGGPLLGRETSWTTRSTLWRLALILAIVALLCLGLLVFTRWRYQHRHSFYKRQIDDPGVAVAQKTHRNGSIAPSSSSKPYSYLGGEHGKEITKSKVSLNPPPRDDAGSVASDPPLCFYSVTDGSEDN